MHPKAMDLSRGTSSAVWGWLTNRLFVHSGAEPSGLLCLGEDSEVTCLFAAVRRRPLVHGKVTATVSRHPLTREF